MLLTPEEEAQVRRYFLGLAPADERSRIEQRLFDDDDWFEQLQAYEVEIIRDYLREKLLPEARRQFEAYCLTNPALQTTIEQERLLLAAIRPSLLERLKALLTSRNFHVALSLSAAAASILVTIWFASDNARLRNEIAQSKQAAPPTLPSQSAVFSILLAPGIERGASSEQNRFSIPNGASIKVKLEYSQAASGKVYRASVRPVGGLEFARERATLDEAGIVVVVFESAGFSTNDYVVSLEERQPDGHYEKVESYSFGIVRP